jgi:site-specific recombinase XerD
MLLPSFLTEQEVEKFLPLPILELRDYAILELLYATGIRGSELVGIDIDDICLKEKAILIKGSKKRHVFFGRKADRCLKYYLKARCLLIEEVGEEKGLFLNHSGKPINLRSVQKIVKDIGSFQDWIRRSPLEHSGTLLPLISWDEGQNRVLFKGF